MVQIARAPFLVHAKSCAYRTHTYVRPRALLQHLQEAELLSTKTKSQPCNPPVQYSVAVQEAQRLQVKGGEGAAMGVQSLGPILAYSTCAP